MSTWLTNFPTEPFKKYSQCGQEGIIAHIYANIAPGNRCLVDFGAGDGFNLSNSRYFLETGWHGALYDGMEPAGAGVTKAWITVESVPQLLKGHEDCDLFLLDLDGNDFWILQEALKHIQPRVIVAEFNASLPHGVAMTMPYNPEHTHDATDHYGASMEAFKQLGAQNGYSLVHQNADLDVFLVKSELLPEAPPEVTYNQHSGHGHKPNSQWIHL